MKFFIDTAEVKEIKEAAAMGLVDGVTTNPSLVAKSGRKLSSLLSPLQRYKQSGEINFNIEDKDGALNALKERFEDRPGCTIDELDGVTIDCFEKDGWWANIRKSNTEPLLRLNCEAKDAKTMEKALALITPGLGVRVDH